MGKRDIYFIYNKEDVQNGVYENYGNLFLILRNSILWECKYTYVKKSDLFHFTVEWFTENHSSGRAGNA